MNNQNLVKNYFDTYAFIMNKLYKNAFTRINELIISLITECKCKDKDSIILEIGCGKGDLLFKLVKKFPDIKITGIDFSISMIELLRKKADKIKLKTNRIMILNEDILDFNFGKNSYNFIISVNMLHHLNDTDKKKIFKNIFHGLIKDGLFIYADITKIASKELNEIQSKLLLNKINENKKLLNTEREIRINHLKLDQPMNDMDILKSFEEIGFKDFGIFYKNLSHTLLVAKK